MIFSPLHNVQQFQFTNGLRVFLKEDHAWPLVSVHGWVNVGSIDEDEAQAGMAHILEHMVFKGTDHFRAAEISRWVESLGGSVNAETAREYTHYYIDAPSAGARQAVHVLGELLHRATLDPVEWERERPVILEEIKRRNDDPDALLWDLLGEALFEEPRLRRPVIGYPETVSAVTTEALKSFYQERYTTGRCVIVVAGDFKTSQMVTWLRRAFERMAKGDQLGTRLLSGKPAEPRQIGIRKPVKQAYLAFGFPTPPATHPDHEPLDLVAAILGDGRNSRLVHQLRETQRLVWSISAANLTHEGPGIFAIFAECDFKRKADLFGALKKLLMQLQRSPPTSEEISRAKNMLQSAWLQGFETYHQQAATIGLFALDNHLERLARYLPKLLTVTQRQLADVIDRYFGALPLGSAVIEA